MGREQFLAFAFAALAGAGYRRLRAVQADAALGGELRALLDNAGKAADDDQRPPG